MPRPITMVRLGALDESAAINAMQLANSVQNEFEFKLWPRRLKLDGAENLGRDSYDFLDFLRPRLGELPPGLVIVVTGHRFIATEYGGLGDDGLYFASSDLCDDGRIAILSTAAWRAHVADGGSSLQKYYLYMFGGLILRAISGLAYHSETEGCFFDACDDPREIRSAKGRLCEHCQRVLENDSVGRSMSLSEVAAVYRLFNRGFSRKVCFVAMRFSPSGARRYEQMKAALEKNGWEVIRADQLTCPHDLQQRILQWLLVSDFMVADLTDLSHNVFYEVGYAHALRKDVLLVAPDGVELPFDLKMKDLLRYDPQDVELSSFGEAVAAKAGPGTFGPRKATG